MRYDLEERTKKFSKAIISLLKNLKRNPINENTISQLIKAATSVGANYCEANATSSNNDFRNKIFICRKEIQETKYWIELLATSNPEVKNDLRSLWSEAHQLTLIFNKISSTLRYNH